MGNFTGQKRQKQQAPPKQQQQSKGTSNGGQQQQSGKTERRPWLKPEHMPDMNGVELDVQIGDEIRLYTGGDFGQQLICAVTDENNRDFDWSIKIGGQQFMRLEKKLGKNLLGWSGKVVAVTRDEYNGNPYVAVIES